MLISERLEGSRSRIHRVGATRPGQGRFPLNVRKSLIVGPVLLSIAFIFSYLDELYIGPLKFGVAWKALVVATVAWIWMAKAKGNPSSQFTLGMLYGLKSLIYYYGNFSYFLVDVSETVKFIVQPLVIETLNKTNRGLSMANAMYRFLIFFVPLSCLPFLLGLEPLTDKYSLDIYGAVGREFYGIFGTKHAASVTLAATIILLLHACRTKQVNRFVGTLLIGICTISLYLTYVRTGYLALTLGVFIYTISAYKARALYLLTSGIVLASAGLYYLASTDDVLRMRLAGTNLYTQDESANQLSSGRLELWQASLSGPAEDGLAGMAVGRGLEKTKDYMWQETGLRVFSHNGFLDAYQTSGVIGLIIFLGYWTSLALMTLRRRHSTYGPVTMALMAEALAVQFVQGGSFFWFQIALAVGISLSKEN